MRISLFEFEDLPWFPAAIREGGTDYLRYFLQASRFYEPVIPVLAEAMQASGDTQILDLCSGGGGPVLQVSQGLSEYLGQPVRITLSDKFPNENAFRHLQAQSGGQVDWKGFSLDATRVPPEIAGFRTLFSAAHHFPPDILRAMLQNAIDHKRGIAFFDGGDKNLLTILGILLVHPIAFFFCTPFFRPFRFSRLLFTYILPLIPLMTIWDGCMSILRLYTAEELLGLSEGIGAGQYRWKAGKVRNRFGMQVAYLVGYPVSDSASRD